MYVYEYIHMPQPNVKKKGLCSTALVCVTLLVLHVIEPVKKVLPCILYAWFVAVHFHDLFDCFFNARLPDFGTDILVVVCQIA